MIRWFEIFGWNEAKLRALLSFSIADVFGGMGSWNDERFSKEEDKEEHERLSAELFQRLRRFYYSSLGSSL